MYVEYLGGREAATALCHSRPVARVRALGWGSWRSPVQSVGRRHVVGEVKLEVRLVEAPYKRGGRRASNSV